MVALAALALVAGIGLGACGDDDKDKADTTTTTTASGGTTTTAGTTDVAMQELDIQAHDFGFDGLPKEIKGGTTKITFTNNGAVTHDLAFVQVEDSTTVDQFVKDFGPVFEGGPTPAYVKAIVAPSLAEPGKTAVSEFTIEPGTYIVICGQTGDPAKPKNPDGSAGDGEVHAARGMAQLITVTEGGSDAPLSEPDGTMTAKDYTFDVDVSDGDSVIRFTNAGPKEDHFAEIQMFPEGTTVAQAEAAIQTLFSLPDGQAPPAGTPLPESVGFSGILSVGPEINFTMPEPFEAGRVYVAMCFISDRTGGPPHAIAHQMVKVFEVK
jgi:plastocyanin